MKRLIMIMAIILLSMSSVNAAQEETIKVGEVVVTASKIEEAIEETTSGVIVIKKADIEKLNVNFVPDILRTIPELNVVQNGGIGKQATILLRGGKTSQTLVLIDGVKVNSTTTGTFDFGGINVDEIESIEIVKGSQSTIYGSEAMAGVINIITKKGSGKPSLTASLEGGSFGTYKPAATVSGELKKVNYRVTGSYIKSDGISTAKIGTEKDSYENVSVSGKLGFSPSEKLSIALTGKYLYDKSELDSFDFTNKFADDLNFEQTQNNYLVSLKGSLYLFDIWEQVLTASKVSDSLETEDPDNVFNTADIKADKYIFEWQNNIYVNDMYAATAGAEFRREDGENKGNFKKSIDNKALFVNNKLKLLEDNLIVNAGLRYDDHETFGDKTTYRVGAAYHVRSVDATVKSSYGTGFRAPSFNELFYPFFGNTGLVPEESKSWDITLEKGFLNDKATLSLTYFHQEYENLIEFDMTTFLAGNIAEAEAKGVEANASVKLTDKISLTTGYNYLDAEDKATGNSLHLRPEHKVTVSTSYARNNFNINAYYTYVGKRTDNAVSRELPSYSLVNLSGSYRVTDQITIFGRVDNLLDEDYEELGGFSTPGLSVYAGVKYQI